VIAASANTLMPDQLRITGDSHSSGA